LGRSGYRGGMA